MSKMIQDSDSFAIGQRRCWWYDAKEGWLCRISIDGKNGLLRVQSGPVLPDEGEAGLTSEDCTSWECYGYDLKTMAAFLEWIVGVVGDGYRLRQAFAHLIRCQYTHDQIVAAGSVCCNVGGVVHRWNWNNVPDVEAKAVSDIGK